MDETQTVWLGIKVPSAMNVVDQVAQVEMSRLTPPDTQRWTHCERYQAKESNRLQTFHELCPGITCIEKPACG